MDFNLVTKDDLFYYQSEDGNLHGEGYVGAYDFDGELAVVYKKNGEAYFINKNFEIVSGPYASIGCNFREGEGFSIITKQEDHLKYYINEDFEIVSGPYFYARPFKDGLAIVKEQYEDPDYYINKNFEKISGPFYFASEFNDGYATIAQYENDDWYSYYINEDFEIVSGPYEHAWNFKNGFAVIKKLDSDINNIYVINKNFEIVSGPYYFAEDAFSYIDEQISNQSAPIDRYLNGEIGIYDLPDECFVGDNLNRVIANEKKSYEYLMNMASEEQKAKIQKDFEDRADFYQGRAFEVVSQDKTTER